MSSQDAKLPPPSLLAPSLLAQKANAPGTTHPYVIAPVVIVNNPDGTKSLLYPGRKNFSALQHSHYTERLDAQRLKRELKQG